MYNDLKKLSNKELAEALTLKANYEPLGLGIMRLIHEASRRLESMDSQKDTDSKASQA